MMVVQALLSHTTWAKCEGIFLELLVICVTYVGTIDEFVFSVIQLGEPTEFQKIQLYLERIYRCQDFLKAVALEM